MLLTQRIQNAVNEIKEISQMDLALISAKGKKIANTFPIDAKLEQVVADFFLSEVQEQRYMEYHMDKILVDDEPEYVLITLSAEPILPMVKELTLSQLRNLILCHTEQSDRSNFIRNILLGNLLAVDIHSKAKKFHIEQAKRVSFVIDTGKKSNDIVLELVKNLSDLRTGDYAVSVDEYSVVLVKDVSNVKEAELEAVLKNIANSLVDNIHMEAMIKVRVGYGNPVSEIAAIAESYKEAKMALEVGRVFYAELDTISYGKLGIGRLIYQLPMSLCDMFIKEVFGDTVPDILEDEEAMSTITKFFENNLNISETARQLYVHRNTLVYRLERIEKAIGLDIRSFDDAMTFRIAVMVLAHMRNSKGV